MQNVRAWLLLLWAAFSGGGCVEDAPQPALTGLADAALRLEEAPPRTAPACQHRSPPLGGPLAPRGVDGASGALVLATWAKRPVAVVADADEQAIHVIDTGSMKRLNTTELPEAPAHVALLEGGRLAVALRYANRVMLLAAEAEPEAGFRRTCDAAITREPIALARHGDGLLVLAGYGAELVEVAQIDLAVRRRIPLFREPRGLMVDPRRGQAWVSHMTGGQLSRVFLDSGKVETVGLHREANAQASRAMQGFALAATTGARGLERIFNPVVSSVNPDPKRERRFAYYGATPRIFEPWVATVSVEAGSLLGPASAASLGWRSLCMLPRAALIADDRLWVACLDEGTVVELDPRFMDPMVALYRQIRVAEGPTALAADGEALFVWSLHGHALTRIQVPPMEDDVASTPVASMELVLPRRADTTWTPRRLLGRKLFTTRRDQRVSRNGAACASCHPDGRDDGLTWATGTTTLFLAGRLADSAPFGWHGDSVTLEERIAKTTFRLRGKGFRAAERDALAALADHVRELRPPPPPRPQSPSTRIAIKRGQKLFEEELTCAHCHPGGGTNGSRLPMVGGLFDTPPLAFVGGSPPYFHDQRYATLEAVLQDQSEPMAPTEGIDANGRRDLIAYLEALPFGIVEAEVPIATEMRHSWDDDRQATHLTDSRVHPGRYIAGPPTLVDVETLSSLPFPRGSIVAASRPFIWASLRDRGGLLRGGNESAVLSFSEAELERGRVVPRILATADGHGDGFEMMACAIHPQRYRHDWTGPAHQHSVLCPKTGRRAPAVALGRFGLGVRSSVDGRPVMLVMGPDAFPDVSGDAHDVGEAERTYSDSYVIELEPGRHAEIVRTGDADHFWEDSAFDLKPAPGVLSVTWPVGAEGPLVLVAELTRRELDRP